VPETNQTLPLTVCDAKTDADPARLGLERAADGRMWLDGRFRTELERAGLTDFDSVMRTARGRCLRVLEDRENWRLELPRDPQPARGVYLKRHYARSWRTWLRARTGTGPAETAGSVEARNIRRLASLGIASMDLVAYGETLHRDGRLESFVLTDELAGYRPLDDFVRARFSPGARRDPDLRRLIGEVASVVWRFHEGGCNHRDLYCCHVFVREEARGEYRIRLIDLQRVQHRRRFRRRWVVKDLAQLAYSAPRAWIGCRQRVAFLRHYLGVGKLRDRDKRLLGAVLAKQRRMERREGPAP